MLARPSVLLVDEPAAGLNQQEQERASQLLFRAVRGGMGVVLIEHSMDMVMSICDRITVLSFGRVIAEGLCNGHSALGGGGGECVLDLKIGDSESSK